MGANAKRKTTMAKLNRERRLIEKRAEKSARKAARKLAASEPQAEHFTDVDGLTTVEVAHGD